MLANYSTTVSVEKTAGEIQGMLAAHGARAIYKEYGDGGIITALAFQVDGPEGKPLSIKLPVDAEAALMAMRITRRSKVAVSASLHPHYRQVLDTHLAGLRAEIVSIPRGEDGRSEPVGDCVDGETAAVIFQLRAGSPPSERWESSL